MNLLRSLFLPIGPLAFGLVCIANLSAQEKQPPPELEKYRQLLLRRPFSDTLFQRFREAWLQDHAADEFIDFLKKDSGSAAAQILLGMAQEQAGDPSAALAAYEEARKTDAGNMDLLLRIAGLQMRSLDYEGALQSLDVALAQNPAAEKAITTARLRGQVLLRLGRNDEALKVWRDLRAAHPDDLDLAEELIELLGDEGQYQEAAESARALIAKSQDASARIALQLRLSELLLLSEKRDDALKELDAALNATGQDTWVEGDVLTRIDQLFRRSDDIEGLKTHLNGLVQAQPQRGLLAMRAAQVLAELGEKQPAIDAFKALLARNPGRRDLQESYLSMLESLDEAELALTQAEALQAAFQGDRELILRVAELRHRTGKKDAARESLAAFLKGGAVIEHDHLRVARLWEAWDDIPAATIAYEVMVAAFPQSLSAREVQAHFLHRHQQREKALAIWKDIAAKGSIDDLLRVSQAMMSRLEPRAAQDALEPRLKEFEKDARYLAALIPAAISNKAFADALRWARQRLMMINEPEPVLDSIRQIRTIITASPEATRDELKTELQGKTPLPVQERCLLADLLDEAGDASAAEKLLAAASPDEAPIVKHQWVEILRLRGDFDKAAAAQQELIALPGGRTTARVQRLIDLIRRGSKPAAALEWFDEWKKLSPGAMQPWLDEARLQRDLGEVDKAIAVLRAAMRRFPDAMEVATAFATQCTEAGQPQEAERVYLSLYEKTQDTGARLRLLGPLAMAAQQRNSLPTLIANFEQRQRQNRASSQPWLALAEIHRASGNDEERRRCLWEASRLRPKDLELLLEIARSEQEIGRLKEALATLETAAALDKTPKTRTQMARLLLEMGESDRGYQIMFEIANADSADPRAVEQFADNLAVAGEWERAEKFLAPLLERFPKDYRLHYLHGMALKESGANDAAATAFLRLLEMHEELPGVAAPGRMLTPTPPDQHLPEGTSEWMALQQIAAQLSQFQMNQRYARSGQYPRQWGGMMPTAGLPQARSVIMPPTVADLSTFTLAQVLEIAATLETGARESLSQQMRSAGIDRSDLLVESALAGPNLPVTEEMLAAHPQDEMLHALLVVQGGLRYAAAEVQGRAFKLFEKKNPYLALQALQAQAQEESPLSVEHVKRLADYVGNLEAPDASTQGQVVQILQAWTSQLAFEDDLKSASNLQRIALMIQVAEKARGWPETLAGWQFGSIVGVYTLADKWETVLALLEEAASKAPQAAAATPHLFSRPWSTGFGRGRGYLASSTAAQMLQPMQCQPPLQPLGISANLSWMAQTADRIYRSQSSSSDKQAQLVQRIADLAPKAKHSGLRLLLHLIGNRKTEADAELSARLNKPDASADDWLVAGWANQCLNDWPSAIERFSKALNHPDVTAQQMHQAGGAISFAASQMQQEGDPKAIEASKPALLALLARVEEQSPAAKAQPDDLYYRAQFLNQLGLVVEAQKLQLEAEKLQQQGQTRYATSPRVAQVSNPYSQSRSYQRQQQSSNPESLEPLMKEGKKDAALKTAVTQLRAAADAWLDAQNFGQSTNTMRRLREQLTKLQLWDEAYAAMKPGEAPTAKALAQWASIQEINGGGTAMIPDYEAALKIAPQLHEARARLVSLYGIPDPEAAVRHLGAMPVPGLQMHLQRLIGEMRPSADDHQVADRPAMARTLARWLAALDTAMRTPSPTSRKAAQQLAIFLPQTQQTLEYLLQGEDQQRLAFPSLVDSEDPFIGGNSSRGSLKNWPREDDGRLKLSDEAKKARDEQLAALEELCRAMVKLPELAAPAFIMLSQLKPDEEAAQIELAREILIAQTMPMNRRRMGQGGYSGHGYYYSQPFSALSNGQSFTHPAVFAIRKAGLRGDRKGIEEELLPLITRGLGAPQARPARRYAELYLCAEKDFPATCDSWRRQTGADLSIAARVWFERKLKTPIDEQVLANLGSTLRQGNLPQEVHVYAIALKERSGPKAMLGFATKVRDLALGSDPAERQKKVGDWIAQMEEQRNRNRSGYYGPSRAASQQIYTFSNWLSEGLQNWGGTELLPLVLEDGWLGSPDWMRNLNNLIHDESKTSTPQEMIEYAAALGLLSDSKDWRGYLQKDGRDQTLLGSMASRIRDRKWSEAVSTLLEKRQPATFGRVLLQALIVHDRTKPVVIEGTNYYINTTDREPRYDAIKQILAKRGAQIADIPQERLPELAALLRSELRDFPDPTLLGPELSKALAPVLASETKALETKIALVLKAEAWTDLPPEMNEGFLSEQFPTLIARVAAQSLVPVKGIVEKTFTLLQSSPEEQRSIARQQGDRYSQRFLWQMAEVPQLLHETLLLARKERLTSNQDWLQNFVSRMTDSDHIRLPAYTIALLTQTPFAAEAPEFVDLQSFDSNEPTSLAKIVNHLEGNAPPEVRTKVLEALANHQPRTFGIELVEAFLKRQPGEPMNRSFYNSKRPDPALLLDLIAKRTEDFSKLSDEGSAALLSLFQARFAAWQTLDAVPDNQRAAATPLFAAKHRSLLIESERWQKAQTLKDLNLTEPHQAIRQATTLLDQISMTDPTAGGALLDQVSQLLSAWETANPQRVANEPRDRLVARWLREAAQTPEVFGQIMERAKELGVDSDEQWRHDTLTRAGQVFRFHNQPMRLVTLLKEARMLDEMQYFNVHPFVQSSKSTCLLSLLRQNLSRAPLQNRLVKELSALVPETFGTRMVISHLLSDVAGGLAAIQSQERQIKAMDAKAQRKISTALAILDMRWAARFAELSGDASFRNPIVAESKALIGTLMKAAKIEDLGKNLRYGGAGRSSGVPIPLPEELNQILAAITSLAPEDRALTMAAFGKVTDLIVKSQPDARALPPYRTTDQLLKSWLEAAIQHPVLFIPVLEEVSQRQSIDLRARRSGFDILANEGALSRVDTCLTTLELAGCLGDAKSFAGAKYWVDKDLPLIVALFHRIKAVGGGDLIREVGTKLASTADAKFGHHLCAAFFLADTDPKKAAAEFQMCPSDISSVRYPNLSNVITTMLGGKLDVGGVHIITNEEKDELFVQSVIKGAQRGQAPSGNPLELLKNGLAALVAAKDYKTAQVLMRNVGIRFASDRIRISTHGYPQDPQAYRSAMITGLMGDLPPNHSTFIDHAGISLRLILAT